MYAAGVAGGVWKSTDGGASGHSIDGSTLYAGTDLGVFVSIDGGASWAVEKTGFANVVTAALAAGTHQGAPTLFAFTHGRGAWRLPLGDH